MKDNVVAFVDKSGKILYSILTNAMPISAATFRPYIGEIIENNYLKPGAGGYNTIISTADRKLNIYSGT